MESIHLILGLPLLHILLLKQTLLTLLLLTLWDSFKITSYLFLYTLKFFFWLLLKLQNLEMHSEFQMCSEQGWVQWDADFPPSELHTPARAAQDNMNFKICWIVKFRVNLNLYIFDIKQFNIKSIKYWYTGFLATQYSY